MRNDLRIQNAAAMLVFAEVVEAGGFTEAAKRLGLSKASVSRQIADLERRLGAQLLRRTTRRMSLTELGELFHARCVRVAEEAEAAERSIGDMQAEPRGELRLAAPMSFGHLQVVPRLPAFLARHPRLRIHVDLSDRRIDLVREKFDLSIRIGASLPDGSFVQRKLCPLRLALCAAPAYVERRGAPRSIEDLREHDCLGYASRAQPWLFSRDRRVATSGTLSVDNGDGLRAAALAGHGIVYVPSFLVADDLRARRLVRLLDESDMVVGGAWAIYPSSRHLASKVRALIDHLVESFGPEPDWDAELPPPVRPRRTRRTLVRSAASRVRPRG
jgi:DNA-binding transcriptional LysR family regulator